MRKVIAGGAGREQSGQPVLLADVFLPAAPAAGRQPRAAVAAKSPPAETDTRCLNAAVRFLKNRPRSEYEVRARLKHHGYESSDIERAIDKLKQKKLIDDLAFARFWVDNRDTFRPRGQQLIKAELRQKGVTAETIAQLGLTSDDAEVVYRAALQKAFNIHTADRRLFQHRLADYLKRRGYGYALIKKAVERVWEEQNGSPG